jgi:deuterolysin
VYFLTSDLRSEDFLTLAAGAKKVFSVETAALHTLDDGGDFDVFAQGALPFANANSTELTGSLDYESNKLKMKINGTEAATVTKAIAKRSTVDTNCNRHQRKAIRTALSNCQRLASSAATAAAAGTKLSTYFNSTTPSTRHAVYARLHSIASECGNLGSVASINCDVSSE